MSTSIPNTDSRPNQRHPQARTDSLVVQQILTGDRDDLNLVELARLRIRYRGFPGAYDIQENLDQALERWNLTEEELFQQARAIHASQKMYKAKTNKKDEEDWS
jgi:hypothetical protein